MYKGSHRVKTLQERGRFWNFGLKIWGNMHDDITSPYYMETEFFPPMIQKLILFSHFCWCPRRGLDIFLNVIRCTLNILNEKKFVQKLQKICIYIFQNDLQVQKSSKSKEIWKKLLLNEYYFGKTEFNFKSLLLFYIRNYVIVHMFETCLSVTCFFKIEALERKSFFGNVSY